MVSPKSGGASAVQEAMEARMLKMNALGTKKNKAPSSPSRTGSSQAGPEKSPIIHPASPGQVGSSNRRPSSSSPSLPADAPLSPLPTVMLGPSAVQDAMESRLALHAATTGLAAGRAESARLRETNAATVAAVSAAGGGSGSGSGSGSGGGGGVGEAAPATSVMLLQRLNDQKEEVARLSSEYSEIKVRTVLVRICACILYCVYWLLY